MIYSALSQEDGVCRYGNNKGFARISSGYQYCGHSSTCRCLKEEMGQKVSATKSKWSNEYHTKVNKKRSDTMMQKYGVSHNLQRLDVISKLKNPKIPADVYALLSDLVWMDNEYNVKKRSLVDIASELNVYYGTVGWYCRKHGFKIRKRTNYSLIEMEIAKFIGDELRINVVLGDWTILGSKEIDILIPSKGIGIEVNGLYWHSYNPSHIKEEYKTRHIDKTATAKEKNVRLMHITDYEWIHNEDIIKSIIRSKMGINTRIYARKCTVQVVPKQDEHIFLDANHLQGYVSSKIAYGLYYDNELVSLMSFGVSRYKKKYDYELLRSCSKGGITVVGGGSRILSAFGMKYVGSLMTYCSLSMSSGNGYLQMGFKHLSNTKPGYFWTDGTIKISRYKSQKSNLAKWLPNFDASKSESMNMFDAGYRRYYDCGNMVFEYAN